MPLPTEAAEASPAIDSVTGLRRLAILPGWLVAALNPKTVIAALERYVPELAAGELTIQRCKTDLRLKGARWEAQYDLTVGSANGAPERELAAIYKRYEQILREEGILDFGDLVEAWS